MSRLIGQRFPLDSELLNKILNFMDTEYDRTTLKAVIFALHSRSQTYELGIKPDGAVNFLSKVLTVADESENALKAAEDIMKLRTRERIENVEKRFRTLIRNEINHYFQKGGSTNLKVKRVGLRLHARKL